MSYKRISVRFNMDIENEQRAWQILHNQGNGLVSKAIIDAIITSNELSDMEKMVRKVVSEELEKVMITPSQSVMSAYNPEIEEAENNILDFLDNL